jgi:hypothetical protein
MLGKASLTKSLCQWTSQVQGKKQCTYPPLTVLSCSSSRVVCRWQYMYSGRNVCTPVANSAFTGAMLCRLVFPFTSRTEYNDEVSQVDILTHGSLPGLPD